MRGAAGLAEFARGGLEVLDATLDEFAERLRSESHTVKRSLTDPRLFSGIGNAYSDEILHRARLSPVKLTGRLTDEEIATLFDATRATLVEWTDRLRAEAAGGISREGHRVSSGDGRARQVRAAVSRVRHAGPANSLRRQRDQLLRALPDGGPAARRPRAFAITQGGLAAEHRRSLSASVIDGAGSTCHPDASEADQSEHR